MGYAPDVPGYGYFHGTAVYWAPTRGVIKHHHFLARRADRQQWGTSQSPSSLRPMTRDEAFSYEGFCHI
jgi:hypothetical protein